MNPNTAPAPAPNSPAVQEIADLASALEGKIKALHCGVETPYAKSALAYVRAIAPAVVGHALNVRNFVTQFDAAIAAKQPTPAIPSGVTIEAIRKADALANAPAPAPGK